MVVNLPSTEREVAGGEKTGLNLTCYFEVVLERIALFGRQTLETDLFERSGSQDVLIELSRADFAIVGHRISATAAFFRIAICPA